MTARAEQPHIGLVVEGAGDKGALPVLLRKHLHSRGEFHDVLGKPVPVHGRDKALRKNGLEGFVATAAARPGCVGVFVVLDGEGDCVAELGAKLRIRASSITGKPIAVALADVDFESWLFASAETLELGIVFDPSKRGQRAITAAIRPAKYVKPTLQPRLATRMNLDLASDRSASLQRALIRFDDLRQKLPLFT